MGTGQEGEAGHTGSVIFQESRVAGLVRRRECGIYVVICFPVASLWLERCPRLVVS